MTSKYTQEENSYWYNYIFDVMAKTSKDSFSIGVNPPRHSFKKRQKATRFVWDLLRENVSMHTSSLYTNNTNFSYMYFFKGGNILSYKGCIDNDITNSIYKVTPITIYEF